MNLKLITLCISFAAFACSGQDSKKQTSVWPSDINGLIEHLNSWDKKELDAYERPHAYPNHKTSGETNAWIQEHKSALNKLNQPILWDSIQKKYTLPTKFPSKIWFDTLKYKPMNNTEKEIEIIAKKVFEAFNNHDWELQASYFSDTCKYLDPSYGTEYKTVSRKDKVAKYKAMHEKSPDIKDSITCIFSSSDKVVIQFISSGTAKTETGEYKWSVPICCVFTFKDDLIIIDETYYNRGK